jgi:hypothetical protein
MKRVGLELGRGKEFRGNVDVVSSGRQAVTRFCVSSA